MHGFPSFVKAALPKVRQGVAAILNKTAHTAWEQSRLQTRVFHDAPQRRALIGMGDRPDVLGDFGGAPDAILLPAVVVLGSTQP